MATADANEQRATHRADEGAVRPATRIAGQFRSSDDRRIGLLTNALQPRRSTPRSTRSAAPTFFIGAHTRNGATGSARSVVPQSLAAGDGIAVERARLDEIQRLPGEGNSVAAILRRVRGLPGEVRRCNEGSRHSDIRIDRTE